MRPRNKASRGYSIIELLIVISIIGIMSLITVPAFMNFQRANELRAVLRTFTADIRNCRQRAITRNSQVRLELDSTKTYRFYEIPNAGTWGVLRGFSGTGPASNLKGLDNGITFSANTLGDSDSNSKNDIVFRPDGTVNIGNGAGTVTLLSPWKNISYNQFVITVTTSGKLNIAGSHT